MESIFVTELIPKDSVRQGAKTPQKKTKTRKTGKILGANYTKIKFARVRLWGLPAKTGDNRTLWIEFHVLVGRGKTRPSFFWPQKDAF